MGSDNETMAALARAAAANYGDAIAARYKRDGTWHDVTFTELWERVRELAVGLVGLGLGSGDRVCILANTSLDFTIADLAVSSIAAIVVPVYPTNSPEECEWVVGNSGARAIFCEDETQAAKIRQVRAGLPDLEHVIVMSGTADGAMVMAELAEQGRGADGTEVDRRIAAATPGDASLIIYTSGTTGAPKGVVLTNKGFAAGRRAAVELSLFGPGDVVYLYLPLAHVFAQLVQADTLEVGGTIAYFSGDTRQIVAELGEVKPNVLPSVPRIFEKVYSVATGMFAGDPDRLTRLVDLGMRVRLARRDGGEVSDADAAAFATADAELFGLVRGIFGGNITLAVSGAAPIAPEILRFFYAAGVPVFEGWGMTETTSIGTFNLPDAFKFGSIGRPVAGATVRIAPDGEIELAGEIVMREYWRNPEATADALTPDGFLKTGDVGYIDDEGYVFINGRKKDIIITAGGKNITPSNLEGDLRRSRWISSAVMYGDRRPYPVALLTLDAEEIVPWAEANGLPPDVAALSQNDDVIAMIQAEVDEVNARYASVEQIKRFTILDHDLSQESGELTPTLKVKRSEVYRRYADEFDELYR